MVSCSEKADNSRIAFDTYGASATYRLEQSADAYMQDEDALYTDSVSLVLPVRLGECEVAPLRDSIMGYALGVKDKPVTAAINDWMLASAEAQGYKVSPVDNHGIEDAQGFDIVSGFIVNMSSEVLVYCICTENYEIGAAHGLTTRHYISYLLEGRGKVLTLRDLFTPEGLRALPDKIREQAQALSTLLGEVSIDGLPSNGNFYMSSEGEIVFSYQPYEVASFAQGTIDVPFYPYELVEYMTPQAIALFHLEDLEE